MRESYLLMYKLNNGQLNNESDAKIRALKDIYNKYKAVT